MDNHYMMLILIKNNTRLYSSRELSKVYRRTQYFRGNGVKLSHSPSIPTTYAIPLNLSKYVLEQNFCLIPIVAYLSLYNR